MPVKHAHQGSIIKCLYGMTYPVDAHSHPPFGPSNGHFAASLLG
jgi:hypothetical protein